MQSFWMNKIVPGEKVEGRDTILDLAFRLNAYVQYMVITFGAISGSGLLSWEQSAETIDFPPIIPVMALWTTVLSALALPLSIAAADEIKDMQREARECALLQLKNRTPAANAAMAETNDINKFKYTEKIKDEDKIRSVDGKVKPVNTGQPDSDLEACNATVKGKCPCIRCISRGRKNVIIFALFTPLVFAGLSFITFLIFLFTVMAATEDRKTSGMSCSACVVPGVLFVVIMAYFMKRQVRGFRSNGLRSGV
ncbi:hypothetical protein DFH11DRAFT_1746363 [Phellopilus nigrolimitatus]|nr:hypothetical protein DFH11DRAFT_1746363 [Phellopilus nigrolimitatus]